MIVGTTYTLKAEPCIGLYELNLKTPDQHERHRYQIIIVVRDDRPAEYRKDLGKTKKFKGVDQFRIPGGVGDNGRFVSCHTVGEMIDMANKLRGQKIFDKRELAQVNFVNE